MVGADSQEPGSPGPRRAVNAQALQALVAHGKEPVSQAGRSLPSCVTCYHFGPHGRARVVRSLPRPIERLGRQTRPWRASPRSCGSPAPSSPAAALTHSIGQLVSEIETLTTQACTATARPSLLRSLNGGKLVLFYSARTAAFQSSPNESDKSCVAPIAVSSGQTIRYRLTAVTFSNSTARCT